MLVALLDDGLDVRRIPREKIICDLCVGEDGSIRERGETDVLPAQHGSTVADIILQYAPDTVFCSLCIFYDDTLSATCRQLEAGLSWCLAHRIPVVHLSAGTKNAADYERLRRIVAQMILQGQILVAAHSNSEGYCMPACLSGVFCVRMDVGMTGFTYGADIRENGMAFRASSRHKGFRGEETALANSYAAPTVTAAVCIHYDEATGARSRSQALYRKLTGREPCFRTPDFAENAVVVNRSGTKLQEKAFFFRQGKVQTQGIDNGAERRSSGDAGRKKVLVWIPERQGDVQEEKLLIEAADEEAVAGIVYCGTLSQQARIQLRDCLVWEEAGHQRSASCHHDMAEEFSDEAMLPLVMILGRPNEAVWLAAALREEFLRERYACVCISDLPMCYLYGIHPLISGEFTYRELAGIRRGCHPDFMLCCSEHWVGGMDRSRYFVIDVSGICENLGVRADLALSMQGPENAVELAKDRIMGYTWPD